MKMKDNCNEHAKTAKLSQLLPKFFPDWPFQRFSCGSYGALHQISLWVRSAVLRPAGKQHRFSIRMSCSGFKLLSNTEGRSEIFLSMAGVFLSNCRCSQILLHQNIRIFVFCSTKTWTGILAEIVWWGCMTCASLLDRFASQPGDLP